jgi:diaminopimelate epimerase
MAVELDFAKGHGTENDFVIVQDVKADMSGLVDGRMPPTLVRSLCNRHTGIGADGLLRIVPATLHPDSSINTGRALPTGAPVVWFMDYYNADGTTGEMCGNGLRVFARYLAAADLIEGPGTFGVDSRAGVRQVTVPADAPISVEMGNVVVGRTDLTVRLAGSESDLEAVAVDVGNPHLVVLVDDVTAVGPLLQAPTWSPAEAMPDGANVEFVRQVGPGHLEMRVFERGVGETRSCGTGACAAAVVHGGISERPGVVRVDVPGGTLRVDLDADGTAHLAGDAELTFMGKIAIEQSD